MIAGFFPAIAADWRWDIGHENTFTTQPNEPRQRLMPPSHAGQSTLAHGIALMRERQFGAAEASFLSLLKAEPRNADGHYFLGLTLAQAGRLEEGAGHMRRAIALNPRDPRYQLNLSIALMQLGEYEQALISLDRTVALDPKSVHAHFNRGTILLGLNRPDQAIAAFERTISLQPDFAEAYNDLGCALREKHLHARSLAAHQKAVSLQPDSAAFQINVAMALSSLRRNAEALPLIDQVLRVMPGDEAALLVRAQALIGLNRAQEALPVIDAVLATNPHDLKAQIWRSTAFIRLGKPEKALAIAEEVCRIAPENVLTHLARAQAMVQLNRLDEALASYEQVLKLAPDDTDAIWGRGLTLLTLGRFEDGWADYEARKRKPEVYDKPHYAKPLWLGQESLKDKRLFVYWEQGFGDTIHFSRYVLLAAAAGAKVAFSVQDPLLRLFKDRLPNVAVMGSNDAPAEFDLHCPLLSMPLGFGTRLETIPCMEGGYLKAPAQDIAAWRQRLAPAGRRIGLVWSGSSSHLNDFNRSIPLARLQGLLQQDHAWISLQKEVREADRPALEASGILDLSAELRDYADTAALISALDLVITVDTSVAHLAGALGKPCWVMLPFAPDFRWLLDRDDSPWYSGMRLFRQPRPNDWDGVVERISMALSADGPSIADGTSGSQA